MKSNYDVVVLGTGNAGMAAAGVVRAAGRSVAMVESRDVGGTCPIRGCVPKKVLVAAAQVLHQIDTAARHHIKVDRPVLDWAGLIEREQGFVDGVSKAFADSLESRGIDLFTGSAAFTGPLSVAVGGDILAADKIVIATGSAPRKLPIPGAEHMVTSEDLLVDATLRPMLGRPQVARDRIQCEALWVSVSVTPDLGERSLCSDERIVGGNAPIVMQPDHDAVMVRQVLRRVRIQITRRGGLPVSGGDEDVTVVEDDAGAVVAIAHGLRREQLLYVREPIVLERAADESRPRSPGAVRVLLGVCDVEQVVVLEVRVRLYGEQPALPFRIHLRHTLNRIRHEEAFTHDAKPARPFRDQHVAVRKERHRPWSHQAVRDRNHPVVMNRGSEYLRLRIDRRHHGHKKAKSHNSQGSSTHRKSPVFAKSKRRVRIFFRRFRMLM